MEAVQPDGITLEGYGIPAVLKKHTGSSTPALYKYGVCGNALKLVPKQWIDLGPNNDRCIGKFTKCTNGITIMLWVKLIGLSKQFFFTNVYDYQYSSGLYAWLEPQGINNHIRFACWNQSNQIGVGLKYFGSLVGLYDWHHIAIMVHPDSGASIYLNGNMVASKSTWGISKDKGTQDGNVYIGRFGKPVNNRNDCLNAYIDELIIFEKTLSADEVLDIYEQRL